MSGFPNLRHVRLALTILEGASLRGAARDLSLTQPAASLALASLEAFYGVAFFERSARGLRATGYGEALRRRATRFLFTLSRGILDLDLGRDHGVDLGRMIAKITTNQLAAIAGMQQHDTFRAASETTGMQPSSLQRRIDALEETLGSALTHRSKAGAHLNARGQAFGRSAGRALSELIALRDEIRESEGEVAGTVSLGVVRVASSEILPRALLRLSATAPKARFVVVHDDYENMLEALRGGALDCVCSTIRPNLPADIEGHVLCESKLKVFCSPRHPLSRRAFVSLNDLASCRWIGPARATGAAVAFRRMFEREGIEPPDFTVESAWTELTRCLVLDGGFLVLTSTTLNERDGALGGLHMLEAADLRLVRPVWLLHRRGWEPTSLQRLACEVLRRCGEEAADGVADIGAVGRVAGRPSFGDGPRIRMTTQARPGRGGERPPR